MAPLWLALGLSLAAGVRAQNAERPEEALAIPPEPPAISSRPAPGRIVPQGLSALEGSFQAPAQDRPAPASDDTGGAQGLLRLFDGGNRAPNLELSNRIVAGRASVSADLPGAVGRASFGANVGVLHPGAGSGTLLQQSPYYSGSVRLEGERGLDWTLRASAGVVRTRTRADLGDARLRTPVAGGAPTEGTMTMSLPVQTSYADVGKSFKLGRNVGGAVFAGGDAWTAMGDGNAEVNAGAALAVRTSRRSVLSGSIDYSMETGHTTMYRNEFRLFPEAVRARLGFARTTLEGAWKASVESVFTPVTVAVEPSLALARGPRAVQASARFQNSSTPFLPDERGVSVSWVEQLSRRVAVDVTGALRQRSYSMSRETYRGGTGSVGVSIATGRVRAEVRPLRQMGAGRIDTARALTEVQAARDSWAGLTSAALGFGTSKNYEEFVSVVASQVKNPDDLLSVLATLGQHFNDYNYNHNEGNPRNVGTAAEAFTELQRTWLRKIRDEADTGVCITQSQINTEICNTVSQRNGLGVRCMVSTFGVPTSNGSRYGGHSMLVFIRPDGRVTIQDWGGITPTQTGDVLEALRRYQEQAGVVNGFFDITDPADGSHQYYAFTPEGRLALESIGVLGRERQGHRWTDNVHGADITMDRFEQKAVDQARRRRWER